MYDTTSFGFHDQSIRPPWPHISVLLRERGREGAEAEYGDGRQADQHLRERHPEREERSGKEGKNVSTSSDIQSQDNAVSGTTDKVWKKHI